MGNNSFIAETVQFHKVKFKEWLVHFISRGADRWTSDPEGTQGRLCYLGPGLPASSNLKALVPPAPGLPPRPFCGETRSQPAFLCP